MDAISKQIIWQQFGAAIDMLENGLVDCPEKVWGDRSKKPQYWYTVFHTLFWLDYYLSQPSDKFTPPAPFGLEEMDPAGVLPDRVYTKDELLTYLKFGREKCRTIIANLTEEKAQQRIKSGWMDFSKVELLIYTMRHVQHHAGQLYMMLRQSIDSAPRWVGTTKVKLNGD